MASGAIIDLQSGEKACGHRNRNSWFGTYRLPEENAYAVAKVLLELGYVQVQFCTWIRSFFTCDCFIFVEERDLTGA